MLCLSKLEISTWVTVLMSTISAMQARSLRPVSELHRLLNAGAALCGNFYLAADILHTRFAGWEQYFFVQRHTMRALAVQSPAVFELLPSANHIWPAGHPVRPYLMHVSMGLMHVSKQQRCPAPNSLAEGSCPDVCSRQR